MRKSRQWQKRPWKYWSYSIFLTLFASRTFGRTENYGDNWGLWMKVFHLEVNIFVQIHSSIWWMHPAHFLECGEWWWACGVARLLLIHHSCPPSLTYNPSMPLSPRDTLYPLPPPSHFLFWIFYYLPIVSRLILRFFQINCQFVHFPLFTTVQYILLDFHVKVLPYSWLITSFWNMSKTRTKTSSV